jgi:hypothetical protein
MVWKLCFSLSTAGESEEMMEFAILHGKCMHASSIMTRMPSSMKNFYSKLGVVCTWMSQDILVYTGTYRVDKGNGLHNVFFNYGYRILYNVCGRFKHWKITLKYENLRCQ